MLAIEGSRINVGAVSGMAQVNVRVDRSVKERAEEALQLSGRSLPELIKKVVAKVAQGGGQCEEVLAAVDDRQQTVAHDTPFSASWAAADQLYADNVARMVRSYRGAMLYHLLTAQHLLSRISTASSDLGMHTTDNGNKLNIGQRVYRITAPSSFTVAPSPSVKKGRK